MSKFSSRELDYIRGQRLARIATVSSKGQPDVVPVTFEFDGEYFWVGSHNDRARKHRNVRDGNRLVALTIDDVLSYDPWRTRALRVYGTATITDRKGVIGQGQYLQIKPRVSWSFGLESDGKSHAWNIVKTRH